MPGGMKQLATECVQLKERLMRAGLYRTGHEMERAVVMIGFEIAHVVDGEPIPEKYIKQRLGS